MITKASNRLGLGHVKRCLRLGNALKAENIEVTFSSPEDDMVRSLSHKEFDYQSLKKGSNNKISFKENEFEEYDLALFDLLEENLDQFDFEGQTCKTAFIYTFEPQQIFGEPSVIIYPGVKKIDDNEVQLSNKSIKLYSGPEYIILDQKFTEGEKIPPIFQEVKNILITMGGSDPFDLTNTLLNCFQEIERNFIIDIVAGPGYENLEDLKFRAGKSTHQCKIHFNLPSLIKLMEQADLVFAPGGTTRFELCALGVPFVLLAFNQKQEMNNAFFVENYNVGFNLGLGEEISSQKLSGIIDRIENNKTTVQKMSKRGQEIVDGKGLQRSKDLILKLIAS